MRYELLGIEPKEGQWRWAEPRAKKAVANYEVYGANYQTKVDIDSYLLDHFWSTGEMLDFVRLGPDETVQCYIPPQADRLANNVWMDFPHMGSMSDYPTEKSEEMLRRVIKWTSNPGDLVLDCFIGSGTTAAVAQKFGRRWIGCDINKGAIQTASKRLQTILQEQIEAERKRHAQSKLIETEPEAEAESPRPAQLSFAVYRVNDYDLQVQHNEAVNLACEHIGITRTRTDPYFDGTLGPRLAKIIPFGRPLSLLDMEELRRELEARPDEDRDLVVVCLGKETSVDGWLENWNRLRRQSDVPNKIEVIELRTDPKYGQFFAHQPAQARVCIQRIEDQLHVQITDFISPAILEWLQQQSGILKPQIDDWRSQVDSVMIDPTYDGQVFRVAQADVPEKKTDLVDGQYILPAPQGETTVAVKITDMLGDEVLVTERV